MRIVIQRVKRASVSVEEKVVGSIQKGFLVLIGVGQGDDEATADKYMKKLLGLRIFEDEWKDEQVPGRCGWTASDGFTVYPVCQL